MTQPELETVFLTAEKLYREIDDLVNNSDLTYFEATIQVCDEKNIDFEDIKKLKLVAPILYSKLYEEAMVNRMLKSVESILPI